MRGARRAAAVAVCLSLVHTAAAAPDTAIRALIDGGHFKQARAALEPRVKANPADAEAAAQLSRVRYAFGDLDGALALADTAVTLEPKNADYHWQIARVLLQQVQQASVFKQMGLSKRFRQEAAAAMALDPQHVASRRGAIPYYVHAPGIAGGDVKKAQALVEEVATIDPASGYLARAQYLNETKSGGGDLEALYQQAAATARAPQVKYEAIVSLVNLYVSPSVAKYDAAEQQGRALVALDAHRISGYSALAIVYAHLNRPADLDAIVADADKAVPDNAGPYFQAGRALLGANRDLPRAERYLRKYLTTEPEAAAPTLAQAHRNLGLVLEKEGRKAEAIASLEQAVKLNPEFEDAKKDLKRMR